MRTFYMVVHVLLYGITFKCIAALQYFVKKNYQLLTAVINFNYRRASFETWAWMWQNWWIKWLTLVKDWKSVSAQTMVTFKRVLWCCLSEIPLLPNNVSITEPSILGEAFYKVVQWHFSGMMEITTTFFRIPYTENYENELDWVIQRTKGLTFLNAVNKW